MQKFSNLQESNAANLCPHAIYSQGYGTHWIIIGSGSRTLRSGTRSLLAVCFPELTTSLLDRSLFHARRGRRSTVQGLQSRFL